jgi:hypothetical protein
MKVAQRSRPSLIAVMANGLEKLRTVGKTGWWVGPSGGRARPSRGNLVKDLHKQRMSLLGINDYQYLKGDETSLGYKILSVEALL